MKVILTVVINSKPSCNAFVGAIGIRFGQTNRNKVVVFAIEVKCLVQFKQGDVIQNCASHSVILMRNILGKNGKFKSR